MSQVSTELWRKQETVPLSKFPVCCHAPIRKGLQVMRGEILDDTLDNWTNESKEVTETRFSSAEMDILREKLGAKLVHGDYTMQELKDMLKEDELNEGYRSKRR